MLHKLEATRDRQKARPDPLSLASGHIANAVYAYYKGGSKGGYFTGLGLKCAKVITVSDTAHTN